MTADDKSVENLLRALRSEPEAVYAARTVDVRLTEEQVKAFQNSAEIVSVPAEAPRARISKPLAYRRAARAAATAEYLRGYQDALDGRTANP